MNARDEVASPGADTDDRCADHPAIMGGLGLPGWQGASRVAARSAQELRPVGRGGKRPIANDERAAGARGELDPCGDVLDRTDGAPLATRARSRLADLQSRGADLHLAVVRPVAAEALRSEEHTSDLHLAVVRPVAAEAL